MTGRYGSERIKRSLTHFILGKAVSAIAGGVAIILVIRLLSVADFAAYSVLIALVEILTALSGFGIAHAILRYVPELYAKHYEVSLHKFVVGSVVIRSALLLVLAAAFFYFAESLAPTIGLHGAIDAYRLYLLVVVLRSSAHFLSQILESTLHQGIVQLGFTLTTVARLAGMVYLLQKSNVQLIDVIWIEAISDALGLLAMASGIIRVVKLGATDHTDERDSGWLSTHLRQIIRFSAAGYMQHLAILPYGGHTNRLVGGWGLSAGAMASFGFAQTLYEYVKRYLPAQMLVGLIRPVVVARYSVTREFSAAAQLCGKVLQINLLLIGGLLVTLGVGGEEALSSISNGKYGADSAVILGLLIVALLFETQRQQLELLVQTVERYKFLILSNALLSASFICAILLLSTVGAIAFPITSIVTLVLANAWTQHMMHAEGFFFQHDWRSTIRLVLVASTALIVGESAKFCSAPWYLATLLAALAYVVLAYVYCGAVVRSFVENFVEKRGKES